MKLCIFGTHPIQTNGYSRVVHELGCELAKYDDIELCVFGFQKFHEIGGGHRQNFPFAKVHVYDAWANEEPKQAGFGIDQIVEYMKACKPDVVCVYNDMSIVSAVIAKLEDYMEQTKNPLKILVYADMVYLCQRKQFIDMLNKHADAVMCFTPYWQGVASGLGVTKPLCNLMHGINAQEIYPIDKAVARRFFNLSPDDFILLNVNRNQPRKRWDLCLQAFAEVLVTHRNEPIKLLIGTALQGGWNLIEVFERELGKRGIPLEEGMRHVIVLDNPQKVSDFDNNTLYSVADVGINTCDGGGVELGTFESAALGIPQVASWVGGIKEFLTDDCANLAKPVMTYYVDTSRDMVCGEAELCDYRDFARGIIDYYENAAKRADHGRKTRQNILTKYPWTKIAAKLRGIALAVHEGRDVGAVTGEEPVAPAAPEVPVPPAAARRRTTKALDAADAARMQALREELDRLMAKTQDGPDEDATGRPLTPVVEESESDGESDGGSGSGSCADSASDWDVQEEPTTVGAQ